MLTKTLHLIGAAIDSMRFFGPTIWWCLAALRFRSEPELAWFELGLGAFMWLILNGERIGKK